MVHVIARCVIKEGSLEKFLQILNDNIPNVLAEDGCIRYEACLDADAASALRPTRTRSPSSKPGSRRNT